MYLELLLDGRKLVVVGNAHVLSWVVIPPARVRRTGQMGIGRLGCEEPGSVMSPLISPKRNFDSVAIHQP